jgi:hypothetical protein
MERRQELEAALEALMSDPDVLSSIFEQFIADGVAGQREFSFTLPEQREASGSATDEDGEAEDKEQP